MIVVCKTNTSQCDPLILPRTLQYTMSESNYVVASEWYTINKNLSGYCVTEGREYQVYGIAVYGNQKRCLIIDDNQVPGFFPIDLFQIHDSSLFFDWKICEYTIASQTLLFIGYPTLCESYSNLVGLIEGQSQHVKLFLSYKDYLLSNAEII